MPLNTTPKVHSEHLCCNDKNISHFPSAKLIIILL